MKRRVSEIPRTTQHMAEQALSRIHKIDVFDETCASHQAVGRLADKWTLLLIYALAQGTKRYSELQRQIAGISPKMLTQTLRSLEQNGYVEREIFPEVPPRVEYSLTELGVSFVQPVAVLYQWAQDHKDELIRIRSRIARKAVPR
ncbi:MAG TPA: helix-turn-helix domain-containing protein [Thermoanaerobaculia bacterium]|nr:helix-turn-helix domain-containing protein [Thermoanaerobaculia bacterium]